MRREREEEIEHEVRAPDKKEKKKNNQT